MDSNSIVIIDYGMGNIGSVANMIKKAGGNAIITSDHEQILKAKKLLLPGVGAFDAGMTNLHDKGLTEVIKEAVSSSNTTLLGICLGMQLLFDKSEEGELPGMGLISGSVHRFVSNNMSMKIPHMGWNSIHIKNNNPLMDSLEDSRYYFVHSYYVKCNHPEDVVATTQYIVDFDSIVRKNKVYGAQFHPEKSHKFGLTLFQNFIAL
ncbi:imidazole glycerol phosphate synthase subunit HisH [Aquirufa sp. Wall-65K1]